MNKQKIQLNYIKNHYTEQNKQYKNKDNIIKDKNQLNDNRYSVGQPSTSVQFSITQEVTIKSLNTVRLHWK